MRIQRHSLSRHHLRRVDAEVACLDSTKRDAGRVCGETCSFVCSQCGSTTCQCRCSPFCPEAGKALSADPERYPIEPRILPLVFAMKRLRVFDPCWSCEGHAAADGSLWKMPMVWFYCRSMLYLRILKDGLNHLKLTGKVNSQWEILVTFSDPENLDTTFSIQPSAPQSPAIQLSVLQDDAREIAGSFDEMIREGARALCSSARRA